MNLWAGLTTYAKASLVRRSLVRRRKPCAAWEVRPVLGAQDTSAVRSVSVAQATSVVRAVSVAQATSVVRAVSVAQAFRPVS